MRRFRNLNAKQYYIHKVTTFVVVLKVLEFTSITE